MTAIYSTAIKNPTIYFVCYTNLYKTIFSVEIRCWLIHIVFIIYSDIKHNRIKLFIFLAIMGQNEEAVIECFYERTKQSDLVIAESEKNKENKPAHCGSFALQKTFMFCALGFSCF